MKCPKCKLGTGKTKLITLNTSTSTKNDSVKRRRRCNSCGHIFTTREFTSDEIAHLLALKQLLLSEGQVSETDSLVDCAIEDLKTGIVNLRRLKNIFKNHSDSKHKILLNLKGESIE